MKKIIYLLTALMLCNQFYAQDLDLKWAEKKFYNNKKDGFFSAFLSSNYKYTYTLNRNLALSSKKANKKIKLIAHDKESMDQKFELALIGYPENKASAAKYKGLEYLKTAIYNNKVLVFWIKKDKNEQVVFVESFSENFKRDKKLTKIYTYNIPKGLHRRLLSNSSYINVLTNDQVDDLIIIGSEVQYTDDEAVFEFIEVDQDLSILGKNELRLPGVLEGKSYGKMSYYTLGGDRNIYIKTLIREDKEEIKKARKERKSINYGYNIFSIWNTSLNNLTSFELKEKDKIFNDFSYEIYKDGIYIYGFFGDLSKDKTGNSTHGIFYTQIKGADSDFNGVNYTYFTKNQIDELFKNDLEDKKQSYGITKRKKEKTQENADVSISASYTIENIFKDKGDIVLFFSKMNNYSVTTCSTDANGNRTCHTRYYCAKSNVSSLKISEDGEVLWVSNIDRAITYNGTSIYDLNIVQNEDSYIAIYGSALKEVDGKKRKKRKKKSEARNYFEYGIFNKETGKNSKHIFQVNGKDEEEKKMVSAREIKVLDNRFYVSSVKVKQNWGKSIPLCIGGIACPYIAIIPFLNGNFKNGEGNLGIITPLK